MHEHNTAGNSPATQPVEIDLDRLEEAHLDSAGTAGAAKTNAEISVLVRLRDPWLMLAVPALLEREGFKLQTRDQGDSYVVTDDASVKGQHVTRIIGSGAGVAQASIEAMLTGKVGAVITGENPALLPVTINAVANGLVVASSEVYAAARKAPFLSKEQAEILELVAQGLTNEQIARRLEVTPPAVKRIVTILLRTFEATKRTELVKATREVGYQVRGR